MVRHARAALLARLDMAQRRSVPTVRPAGPRRPAAPSRPWRKDPSRPIGAGSSASRPAVDLVDDRHGFARRLNDALFRALRQEAAEPADRRSFAALVAGPAGASGGLGEGGHGPSGRLSRTSWLRLMFVAYSCSDQPASTGHE